MTEPRHDELFTAIRAHRDALVRSTGDLAVLARSLEQLAAQLAGARKAGLGQMAATAERIAMELGSGLERLSRLADVLMDDTRPMDRDELARANANDEE